MKLELCTLTGPTARGHVQTGRVSVHSRAALFLGHSGMALLPARTQAARQAAIELPAERLCLKMESLDPSGPASPSERSELSERQQQFYRLCVRALLYDAEVVAAALG